MARDDDMESVYSLPPSSMDGVQAINPTTSSYGAQTINPTTSSSETQTRRIKTKEHGSQATEDRIDDIERLRHASELEKQALIQQHAQNVERIRQQVIAEAETSHHRIKEE